MKKAIVSKLFRQSREPKIGDFEITIFIKKEVFRLEIAVGDTAAMAEIDCGDQLLEVRSGEVFPELSSGYLGEEFAAFDIFHDKENLGFSCHNLFQLDNIRVSHQSHHRDFSLDLLHHSFFLHLIFVYHFDRHALSRLQLFSVVNLRKRAFSQ
ncbi:hypothetical protein CsSME_00014501 [Camellia sinensis var. sinensis]